MRILLLALVPVLLLAGCAAPAAQTTPDDAPEDRSADEREESDVGEQDPQQTQSSQPAPKPKPSQSQSNSGTTTTGPAPGPTEEPEPEAPEPRTWASPDTARIRPGASLNNGGCTANFVFTSPDNSIVYLGTAAHCFSTSGNTETNGCRAGTEPLGTTMEVHGASRPAVLVYSSWVSMHERKESDADACAYNDFALLQLDPVDYPLVSPAMYKYGGPTGIADGNAIGELDKVLTYGNSGLRPRDSPLSPKEGYVSFSPGSGWSMDIYTFSPGVPGDSGSGVLTADGQAIGDLVTLSALGSNGVTMLTHALAWASAAGFHVELATWELLDPGILPE